MFQIKKNWCDPISEPFFYFFFTFLLSSKGAKLPGVDPGVQVRKKET